MTSRRLTTVSLLLLVLCGAAWVRSYLPEDFYLRAHRGSLVLIFADPWYSRLIDPGNNPSASVGSGNQPLRLRTPTLLSEARQWGGSTTTAWQRFGLELIAYRDPSEPEGYVMLAVPFWAIALPLALVSAWGLAAGQRRRRRQRTGRCLNCGYDLRASSDRCPECGTPTPTEPRLPVPAVSESRPRP